ncbi:MULTISPECIES: folylpolyglutamate synthase/dihydrofolate synthase family protein [unclassified Meiothermus]|uniref:bifunctional folylpolyglutamate synthase/dihydrofolate synthase n=1 Tax=unclassified Meiothermus TaxID=370471 RepID=UPI000D7BD46A|nr:MULTISPECIES: Mur ligase family protein [unclassified Meiothermus]PZA06631.1 bifunctional folylpolyglutamate synthase/dihydrofolate synthase [Meiothermus sp. Pnk-1]RYM37736.1 bifunctional folylpolyglutamate synthase/dihydrofolate synthase [Meiothermus sp. PNK-Is4]
MTYAKALEWLYGQTRSGAPRGTRRVGEVLERLGHPERRFPAVHVLGTNGKGSVVAYLEAAFRAAGIRYGATTSPHLVDFRERIRTHQGLIPEEQVTRFVEWAREQNFIEHPAFFDLATALAFEHFAKVGVEMAAVEAGVGGVLDATNILSEVRLTVLTNVGEDHLETLGGSLEAVARDKAGAFRPGVPVITAAEGIGLAVAREVAQSRRAPLYVLEPEDALFELPVPPALRGEVQRQNARLAAAALRLLGFPEPAIVEGLRGAVHPGRMQELEQQGVRVILDGAHNPPAARALAEEFSGYHLVYGAFPRKDYAAMLKFLLPKARSVRYTRAGVGALQAVQLSLVHPAPYFEEPLEALEDALRFARQDGEPVLVTGSLYLVGEMLKASAG